jgi:chemotaxis protein histidine kinase CheA
MNLKANGKKILALAVGALWLWAGPVAAMAIILDGSGVPPEVRPGQQFEVSVMVDTGNTVLGSYLIPLSFDGQVFSLVNIKPGLHPEFPSPITSDYPSYDFVKVWDDNEYAPSCQAKQTISLFVLTFEVLKTAPPESVFLLEAQQGVILRDCEGNDITSGLPPYPWPGVYVTIAELDPMGAYGMSKFLDLDGDGLAEEDDAIRLQKITTQMVQEGETALLRQNARQCDLNANGLGDVYDAGRLDAITRPARLINAGQDGLCQTVAAGDDDQSIAPPNGEPFTVTVDPASALPAARFLVVAQKVREAFPGARMEPDLVTLQKTQGRRAVFSLPASGGLKELARLLLTLPEVASVTVEEEAPRAPAGERALIRDLTVSARDLDDLLDRAAELLHSLNRLEAALDDGERKRHRFWLESHRAHLGRLSDRVLAVRLVPFDALVERLKRTVREVGGRLGKRAVLEVSGAEEKIDRGLLERLQDPLLHLVRNALDHGLEGEEERRAAGKPPEGRLRLEIRRVAEALLVTLSDDGRGIDPEAVRRTAVERRLCTPQEAALLTEDRLYELLTLPAFSTRREVSEVSGRGVGLDVVRLAAEALGGHLEIRSAPGKGSAFTLVVPSASALTRILVFSYGEPGPRFGIPVSQVTRIYPLSAFPVTGGARPFLADGDTLIPVLPWRRREVGREGFGLRLTFEGQDHALLVGSVFQMERVVIQPLGPPLDMVPEWMGAALLSTGEVAYVLDGRAVVRRGEGESHAV